MIPDAPGLPPGTLAYAEYGECFVILSDMEEVAAVCDCFTASAWSTTRKYSVGRGPGRDGQSRHDTACALSRTVSARHLHADGVCLTDSEAEALAEFNKQAESLRHRDRLAEKGQ